MHIYYRESLILNISLHIEYIKWQHCVISTSYCFGKRQANLCRWILNGQDRHTCNLCQHVLGRCSSCQWRGRICETCMRTKASHEWRTLCPIHYTNHHLQLRLCLAWACKWKWINFHRICAQQNFSLEVLRPDWLK